MRCPSCHSENCYVQNDVTRQGYGGEKGCCGYILLGPLGLLCGLCGKDDVKSEEKYWLCNNCGRKFDENEARHEMERYQAQVKAQSTVQTAESKLNLNPNAEKYLEQKKEVINWLSRELSSEERENAVFFETGTSDERAENIFLTYAYAKHVLDLEKECIFFMYNYGANNPGGIVVASNGVYYKKDCSAKFIHANQIKKVFVEGKNIYLGNSNNEVSFEFVKEMTTVTLFATLFKFLYVKECKNSVARTSCNGYGDHINTGCVAEVNGKIFYNSKDRKSIVMKDGNDETKILDGHTTFMTEYDGYIYLTGEHNRIERLDPATLERICIREGNCHPIHLHKGTFAFCNSKERGIYLMNLDGSNARKISDDLAEDITLTDDCIYYINKGEKSSIYRVRRDGSERTKIFDGMKCDHLMYDGEYLYFESKNFNTLGDLYRMHINSRNVEKIHSHSGSVYDYIVTDTKIYISRNDGIIWMNKNDIKEKYYFIKQDKSEFRRLCVVNGFLYFGTNEGFKSIMYDRSSTYRVDCEGGSIEEL